MADALSRRRRQRLGEGQHRTESRNRVAGQRLLVSIRLVGAHRYPARVAVFDDYRHRLLKLARQSPGGVQVEQVVVGKLLALELPGTGNPPAALSVTVERRPLVGIFSVAQVGNFLAGQQ